MFVARYSVRVMADYCGSAGSRWAEVIDQFEQWALTQGLRQPEVGKPGCSTIHDVVQVCFMMDVEAESSSAVPGAVKEWARKQPLLLRGIDQVALLPG